MGRYRAVLLDWRGILVHDPEPAWRVGRALESIGRPVEGGVIEAVVNGLNAAVELPEVVEAERYAGCSSSQTPAATFTSKPG